MHYFKDFKGFANAELDLTRPLTVLIGPNGSGKSNIIEGIELLSFIAQGGLIHEITDVGRSGGKGLEIRGGLESCPSYGKDTFYLGYSARVRSANEATELQYRVGIATKPHGRIVEEKLHLDDGTLIFETVSRENGGSSEDMDIRYNNFSNGGKKPIVSVAATRSALSQYAEFVPRPKSAKHEDRYQRYMDGIKLAEYIQDHLESFVFDPNPKLMRSYERIGNSKLSRNGANLSAVLYALASQDPPTLDQILGWIKQLPEEPYTDIDFVTTRLGDVIFGLISPQTEQPVDARLLSDGTLRCLAVMTALETVYVGSRVIIEEFDNGLHPSRIRVLTEALNEGLKHRGLNVLVTTHNPATLNALEDEQLSGVVLCAWKKEDKTFDLIRLSDLRLYPEILERGRLGDLMTRRVLEQYVSPDFEETRKREALEWLESLQ